MDKSIEKRVSGNLSTCEKIGDLILHPGVKAKDILDLQSKMVVHPSDIFITSYLRSGTNWISYIIQLIVNNGDPLDKDLMHLVKWADVLTLAEIEAMSSPRYLKCHLPYEQCVGGPPHKRPAKYIYSYRNPRDVAHSLYLMKRKIDNVTLSWTDYLDIHIRGDIPDGSQLDNIRGWWEHRDSPNILILQYESMKKDTAAAVRSISTFLGYSLSEELIKKIAFNASFDEMKKNLDLHGSYLTTYKLVRKGVIGDWRNHFSREDIEKMDAAVINKLGHADIVFDYGDD